MEEVALGHLQHFVEVLAVSQLDCVSEWDENTVLRAFKWARYCEQIHAESNTNPVLRSALESRLHDTNQRLQDTLASYSPITLSDLARCQHKLLIHLLSNPSSPSSIIHRFFFDPKYTEQGLQMDRARLIASRSAFKQLCCGSDWTGSSGFQVETEVRGKLLGKRLDLILSRSGSDLSARTLLDSILRDSEGKTERLYDVIAAALLADRDGDVSGDVILHWLQSHDGCLAHFCRSMSPEICCDLSKRSVTFKRAYWDILTLWANSLEYDVMHSAWGPTGAVTSEKTITFHVLFERFRALLNSAKEETETSLAELKVESGDFDVRGLSVWTDLILMLKV